MGSMGLVPAALSRVMGSEIKKPLAIKIVFELIVCMLLALTVLPAMLYYANRKKW